MGMDDWVERNLRYRFVDLGSRPVTSLIDVDTDVDPRSDAQLVEDLERSHREVDVTSVHNLPFGDCLLDK